MMSDSESSDSDTGIRFKTTSTRHKEGSSFSSYSSLRRPRDEPRTLEDKRYSRPSEKNHRASSRDRDRRRSRSPSKERRKSGSSGREKRRNDSKDRRRSSKSPNYSHPKDKRRSRSRSRDDRKRDSAEKRKRKKDDDRKSHHHHRKGDDRHGSRSKKDGSGRSSTTSKSSEKQNDRSGHVQQQPSTSKTEEAGHSSTQMTSKSEKTPPRSTNNRLREPTSSSKDVIVIESEEESTREAPEPTFGPILPPKLTKPTGPVISPKPSSSSKSNDFASSLPAPLPLSSNGGSLKSVAICGPALPPHLFEQKPEKKKVLGPSLPPQALLHLQSEDVSSDSLEEDDRGHRNEDDESSSGEQDCGSLIGPMPIGSDMMTTAQLELEKRALELKLAKLDGSSASSGPAAKVREEWMLELPAINTLKNLGPVARQFRAKEGPDFSDRSSWTETPQDKEKKKKQHVSEATTTESMKEQTQFLYEKARDAEQERMAKKHKKKHKRDESLLDIHRKKLKKQKKEGKKSDKAERRPFSRDVDLKVNRFDEAQKNSIIKKAQLLDTRFSSGQTKYL